MKALGKILFRLIGWQMKGSIPTMKRCVIIITPHTSNWDFVIALLGRLFIEKPIRFLGKHQLFFFPLSLFMRALGGIPVNRKKHNNLVNFCLELFKKEDKLYLTIAPEGTRSPVTRWKVGFYHIAKKANVPIVIMGIDYKQKAIIFSPPITPSNNMKNDFDVIIDFAKKIKGYHAQTLPAFHSTEK